SAQDIAEFQKELATHFAGNYGAEPYKRATNAIGERVHQLNNEFISPYAELVGQYDKLGQGKRIREKIASKMEKPLDEVTEEQLQSFYDLGIEAERTKTKEHQARTEQRDAAHMAELIARSNQPAPERLEAMKRQHLEQSKQRLTQINRDGRMSEQAVNEYHAQAEADAQASVDNFVKVQTGAF
ncbi:MAG: hypothetical protein GY905_15955, partial [Gammaproteobacteria bacterium]|nr:hypothetical protein [Gammaproteobacteria bacterium]